MNENERAFEEYIGYLTSKEGGWTKATMQVIEVKKAVEWLWISR